ncbi:MAG: glycosyltransferase family 4 protein, partial [Planctomycetota bacterium]|nr:glycosyltransferase family 4 protein [Planctomycetota bacterium]
IVRELNLEKHVTFAHPGVPHGQILSDADLYVQTSKEEGFGVSTLEAMAWGLPVVATSVGGLITLVRDGQTGFLVPVGNPGAVAGKMLDLLGDRALREKMGQAARTLVAEQYSAQQMIDDTEHLYAEVMGLVPAPSGIYRFRSPSGQYRAIVEKNG